MKFARRLNRTLKDVFAKRATARRRKVRERFAAELRVHSLEPRRLLSATTNLTLDASGNLIINDVAIGGRADSWTLQADNANSRYVVNGGAGAILDSSTIATASGNGTQIVFVPFAAVTGNAIQVQTGSGNDSLTLDFALGNFGKQLSVQLGNDADSLSTTGNGSVAGLSIDGEMARIPSPSDRMLPSPPPALP